MVSFNMFFCYPYFLETGSYIRLQLQLFIDYLLHHVRGYISGCLILVIAKLTSGLWCSHSDPSVTKFPINLSPTDFSYHWWLLNLLESYWLCWNTVHMRKIGKILSSFPLSVFRWVDVYWQSNLQRWSMGTYFFYEFIFICLLYFDTSHSFCS